MTVVVPSRDRSELLAGCLDALRHELLPDDELVVVDSASRDAQAVRITAERFQARLVRCERPGASLARNLGWRSASHEAVAFVDDDVRVAAGWRKAVADILRANPDTAFFTGRLEAPPGQVDTAATAHPIALQTDLDARVIGADTVESAGHGANIVVRRVPLERTGGFDELLGAGGRFRAAEDQDLFDRLLAGGFLGRYEPDMLAYHVQWRGRRQLVALEWSYGFGTGVRLVKVARVDRRRARRLASRTIWTWTLKRVPHDLFHGYEFGVAFSLARFAGIVAGAAVAARVPVEEGHLQGRTTRRAGHVR
jgi:glycosyltransferase involved in cell wall biosynthesis